MEEQKPEAAPAPAPVNDAPKWLSQLSPDRREKYAEQLKDRPTLNDLTDSYVAYKGKVDRALIVPNEGSDETEIKEFYTKMGIPDTEDGYEIEVDKSIQDNDKFAAMFKKNAITAGLTKAQAKKEWEFFNGLLKGGVKEQKSQSDNQRQTFDARLMKSLEATNPEEGARNDAAKETVNLFKRHLSRMGKGVAEIYSQKGLIYDPAFVLAIARDEKSRGSPQFVEGESAAKAQESGGMGTYHSEFEKMYGGRK